MKKIMFLFIIPILLYSCAEQIDENFNINEFLKLSEQVQIDKYQNLTPSQHLLIWTTKFDRTLNDNHWTDKQKSEIASLSDMINLSTFANRELPNEFDIQHLEKYFSTNEIIFLLKGLEYQYSSEVNYSLKNIFIDDISSDPKCTCNENDNGVYLKSCSSNKECEKTKDCETIPLGCGFIWLNACDGLCRLK